MRAVKHILVLILVLFMATDVMAEDKKWSDEAEFSYVETGGNTEVKTLSLNNTLKYSFSEKLLGTCSHLRYLTPAELAGLGLVSSDRGHSRCFPTSLFIVIGWAERVTCD